MPSPEDDARRLADAFYAAKRRNPEVVPYIGPEESLNRFLAGEVITERDYVTDQSPFTIKAVLPVQLRRMRWMLDNVR